MKKQNKRAQGQLAEKMAALWFRRNGYRINHVNWYANHREIDLIVENQKRRVFVEVKYNNAHSINFPEAKVNRQKQIFLQQCARSYSYEFPTQKPIRFDILAITQSPYSCQLYHIKDAFFGRHSYKRSARLSHFYDIDFNLKRF